MIDAFPVHNVADAIRWACVLESTAPKVGNVYPGRSFHDLTYLDFVRAANIVAETLVDDQIPIGQRIAMAVKQSRSPSGGNVNLGIVLLIAPMIAPLHAGVLTTSNIESEINSWTDRDAANIYAVIGETAGGLGNADSMDVRDQTTIANPPRIVDAMRAAADRDRVALQYATGFADLLQNVVPVLQSCMTNRGDVLLGIRDAAIELLAAQCDSLIVRKNGLDVARQVQCLAAQTDRDDVVAVAELDAHLRHDGNRLNPGTTADLIAAALFVLLVQPLSRPGTDS